MKLFSEALSERNKAPMGSSIEYNEGQHEMLFQEAVMVARDTDMIIGGATATFDAFLLANHGKDEGMLYAEGAAEFVKTAWGHIVAMWEHLKAWFNSLIGKVLKVHGAKIEELKKRVILYASDAGFKAMQNGSKALPADATFTFVDKATSNDVKKASAFITSLVGVIWKEDTIKNFTITGAITPDEYFTKSVKLGIDAIESGTHTNPTGGSPYGSLIENTNALRASSPSTGIGSTDSNARDKAIKTFLTGIASGTAGADAIKAYIPGEVKGIKGKITADLDAALKTTKKYSVKDTDGEALAKSIISTETFTTIQETINVFNSGESVIDNVKKGQDFFTEIGKTYKEQADTLTKSFEAFKGSSGDATNGDKGKAAVGLSGVINDIANITKWYTTLMIDMYSLADIVTTRYIDSVTRSLDAIESLVKLGVKTTTIGSKA